MHRDRVSRREHNKIVFEKLWRGTFQAVVARPPPRPRASSHDPNPDMSIVPTLGHSECNMAESLEPAIRTILAACLRPSSCCCRCNCAAERNLVNDLQVCPSAEERKNLRSVIRCAFIDSFVFRSSVDWSRHVNYAAKRFHTRLQLKRSFIAFRSASVILSFLLYASYWFYIFPFFNALG